MKINWHNVNMTVGMLALIADGIFTALKGAGVGGAWVGTALSIALFIEHQSRGNTNA